MSHTDTPVRLADLAVGTRAHIAAIQLPPDIQQRLLEMGLTVGTECTVLRFAPLGDPLEIRVRGYQLAIRRSEAAGLLVSILY